MSGWYHPALSASGASPLDLLMVLFGLSLVPLLAISTTSFTRIVVVLGLLRASLGTPGLPPNSVIAALAVMLSLVIMSPTLTDIRAEAVTPYMHHKISASTALQRALRLKRFMLRQKRASDVRMFERYADLFRAGYRGIRNEARACASRLWLLRSL